MLVGKLNNQLLSLTKEISREALEKLKGQPFVCPVCAEPLVLKIGTIKIPHFSHRKSSSCASSFSEGESEQHLFGKKQLYNQLHKQGENVLLEPYLQLLKQRPDILVEKSTKRYAIEYQCSTVDRSIIEERTINYQKYGYIPIWLLSTPHQLRNLKEGVRKIQLTRFQQLFFTQFSTQTYLITYNPLKEQFVYFSNLIHLNGNSFIATIRHLPLTHQPFPYLAPKIMDFNHFINYYNIYKIYREQFNKNKLFTSRLGVKDPFLRAIYELRLNREELPTFLGVPVKRHTSIKLFTIEWQAAFFYFLERMHLSLEAVTKKHMRTFLTSINEEVKQENVQEVMTYIQLLKKLDVECLKQKISEEKLIETLFAHLVALSFEN